jgi:hypothetical protein
MVGMIKANQMRSRGLFDGTALPRHGLPNVGRRPRERYELGEVWVA